MYPVKACFDHNYGASDGVSVESGFLYQAADSVKVETPIVLTQSKGKFTFSGNNVTRASGSKGFMFVEMESNFDFPSVIYNNTFSKISGNVYSGILNLRRNLGTANRILDSQFCGGFLVESNIFEKSVLCPKFIANDNYPYEGLIKLSCKVD